MAYFLVDSKGYLADFASIGGLADFRMWAEGEEGPISRFVENGYTRGLATLKEHLEDVDDVPDVVLEQYDVLLRATDAAQDILIISDGTGDEDPAEPEELVTLSQPYHMLHVADSQMPSLRGKINLAFLGAARAYEAEQDPIPALETYLEAFMPQALLRCVNLGGIAEASHLKLELLRTAAHLRYDAKNIEAKKWANAHSAELIKGISETTRQRIREAVSKFGSKRATIKEIRGIIRNAERAEVIARTETLRASHEGQRQLWRQAKEKGLLRLKQKRVWITTPDDLLCPECEALDGDEALLEEDFTGGIDAPPAHPNCRCTSSLS